MKILFFGSQGTIGANLARKFEVLGHSVFRAKRIQVGQSSHLEYKVYERVRFDSDADFDLIVNTAGKYHVSPKASELEIVKSSTVGVAESIIQTNKSIRAPILNLSSYFQYMPDLSGSVSDYARYKNQASTSLHTHAVTSGLGYIDIALLDNYGFTAKVKIVEQILMSVFLDEPLICSSKETPINLIHADDLLQGLIIGALDSEIYLKDPVQKFRSLSNPKTYTLGEIERLVCELAVKSSKIQWGGSEPRFAAPSIIEHIPPRVESWLPKVNLEEFILNYIKNRF